MAEGLQNLIASKKDVVENVMEAFEQGAEMLASIAGDMFPIFSIAAPIVKLALENVESKEAQYMKEQFQKVRERLDVISEEIQRINDEVRKSGMDATYFSVEENITNQFRKYMDILNAKPAFRDAKKKQFLDHFSRSGGEKNLHTLYGAVTGDSFSGETVLEITLNYEQKSRRVVEDFCARLKQLFCIGIIALIGYTALKGCDDEEELLRSWAEKMNVVQTKINVVIEDCINSFPSQAEIDIKHLVRDQKNKSNQQLADMIIENLKGKYDWVSWSVRVFDSPKSLFKCKKDFQCATGKSRFQVPSPDENLNVVVSYSASPEPLDKALIMQLVQDQKKVTIPGIAELIFEKTPMCAVHAVKTSCKEMSYSWSFQDELHFFEEFKNFYLFVHSS